MSKQAIFIRLVESFHLSSDTSFGLLSFASGVESGTKVVVYPRPTRLHTSVSLKYLVSMMLLGIIRDNMPPLSRERHARLRILICLSSPHITITIILLSLLRKS